MASTDSINLGEAGMEAPGALAYLLLRYPAEGGFEVLDAGEITIEPVLDLEEAATGSYVFEGLPEGDLGSGDRYQLDIRRAADPLAVLRSWTWSAPIAIAPVVVYRRELDILPGGNCTVGDTVGIDQVRVRRGLQDPTGAVATYTAHNATTEEVLVANRPASISQVTTDMVDGSFGFLLSYQREAAITAAPGTVRGKFLVVFADGGRITIPPPETPILYRVGGA